MCQTSIPSWYTHRVALLGRWWAAINLVAHHQDFSAASGRYMILLYDLDIWSCYKILLCDPIANRVAILLRKVKILHLYWWSDMGIYTKLRYSYVPVIRYKPWAEFVNIMILIIMGANINFVLFDYISYLIRTPFCKCEIVLFHWPVFNLQPDQYILKFQNIYLHVLS